MLIEMCILASIAFLVFILVKRYFPLPEVPMINLKHDRLRDNIVRLDIRDYNVAASDPVQGVLVLPYAYLKRHYREIHQKEIVLVASDPTSLNLGVRFLRRKGFNIIGCYLPNRQTS